MKLEVRSRPAHGTAHATPLLFVHGAWHGAWCWDVHFLDYFAARGWNVHALSLRGHGDSEGRDRLRWTRMSQYVEDVAQVAASLPSPPVVIGHSMGGGVVQKYLERHGAPAAALLASMPPSGVFGAVTRVVRRHPIAFAMMNLKLSLLPMIATPALAREWFFSEALPQDALARYHAQMQDEAYAGFLDMLVLDRPSPRRVRRKFSGSMLVVGAERDTIFSVAEVRATAAAYGTDAIIIPGMAHDVMLEPGWAVAANHVLGWLARLRL